MNKHPWTDDELEALDDAVARGMTVPAIATMLGRTLRSVESKIANARIRQGLRTSAEINEAKRMKWASDELARRVNRLNERIRRV